MTLAELRKQQGQPLPGEHAEESHEHHPGAMEYLKIGAILTIITAVEVALYYVDMSRGLLVALLMILSITKFTLVVLWFMHLKFDNRLFRILFGTGLALTCAVFGVVMVIHGGNFVDI